MDQKRVQRRISLDKPSRVRRHQTTELIPSDEWKALADRFPERMGEPTRTVYSLPRELVDRIHVEAPKLLNPSDLLFERQLAASEVTAFFLGNGVRHPLLRRGETAIPDAVTSADYEIERLEHQVHGLLLKELKKDHSDEEISAIFETETALTSRTVNMQAAYLGWLVTDPLFRLHCGRFREMHGTSITSSHVFPATPRSILGEKPLAPPTLEAAMLQADFQRSFLPWGVDTLLTWELPVLLGPALLTDTIKFMPALKPAGLTLFVPFYLLRTKALDLHFLASEWFRKDNSDHLQPWLEREPTNFGPTRWGRMLSLYVYVELALRSRYKLRGTESAINRALGQYLRHVDGDIDAALGIEEDIRKIRQEMNRRLKATKQEISLNKKRRKPR